MTSCGIVGQHSSRATFIRARRALQSRLSWTDARFGYGEGELIFRWVTEATRKLHPASDCFQGIGYQIRPLPLFVDEDGTRWGSFTATRGNDRLTVYERIYTDQGQSWSDSSAWYWSALFEHSPSPWWAVTIAVREP